MTTASSLGRQVSRVLTVSALTVGVLPFGPVGQAETIRTDTTLGGYAVTVEGAPFKLLVDDPKAAVPRPTGSAIVEGDPNYTYAATTTGPNTRGIAATVWPGNLFGEGLPQVTGNPDTVYPLKAEARYPDKPYTATGKDGGQTSNASALGLDAMASATGAPPDKTGQVTLGDASSSSITTVNDKNVAVGDVLSKVSDVDLLAGVIHIGSVSTVLHVANDGKTMASSGKTTVCGLTIAGQGYTVDDTGVHSVAGNNALPPVAGPSQLAALGITVSGIVQSVKRGDGVISRAASGLIISVETAPLKAQLKPVYDPIKGVYNTIVGMVIPPAQQGQFYYLINASPKLTFVFGSANASSAAILPLSFDGGFPSFPAFPPAQPPATVPGQPTQPVLPGSAPDLGSVGIVGSVTPPTVSTGNVPVLQPPGIVPAASSAPATTFGGINAGWLLFALAVSGGIAFGLMRFLGLAAGVPFGLGCRLGAPTSLPNFRSVTA